MANDLFDTYGRPIKVLSAYGKESDLIDTYGRPIIVPIYKGGSATVEIFRACLVASATVIRSGEDLSEAPGTAFTITNQPDIPRNLTWILTHTQITAFTLVFVGVDAKGQVITDTFTQASGWSGATAQAYAQITSIKMTARTGTGAGNTCNIGTGSILGLANGIAATTSVFKVKKNTADYPAASYTVNATTATVDVSTGGAITGGDDYTIWYSHGN
jgi:hypothetical protein